uniref:Uncharacterized protein n=1 Tax=Thermogemmatispora argillosa TaxID=2045280 RepID=A0A455SZM4_9CHLR|nr:hypothetical protein KTA_12150 [Thermogemmatispora argillosa]
MRGLSRRGAVLLWAASIALMGVVVWQQLLALCFLAEGVVALVAWGLASVLLWWLQEEALSGEGLVGQSEGGQRQRQIGSRWWSVRALCGYWERCCGAAG